MTLPAQEVFRYKVTLRNPNHETLANYSLAQIGISLGHKLLYGEKFAAFLSWTTQRHQGVVISLTDLAYRHNFRQDGLTPLQAYRKALREGNEWLEEHNAILDTHRTKIVAVHRWIEWLKHPDYSTIARRLQEYYEEDTGFRTIVESDVSAFTERGLRRSNATDLAALETNSRQFILEECAAYILIGRRYHANRLYPGKGLMSLDYLRQPNTPNDLKGLENLNHLFVRIERRHRLFNQDDK